MVVVWNPMNWFFWDQKTPQWEMNSAIAWQTWWIATQTDQSQNNKAAQNNWVITNADNNVVNWTNTWLWKLTAVNPFEWNKEVEKDISIEWILNSNSTWGINWIPAMPVGTDPYSWNMMVQFYSTETPKMSPVVQQIKSFISQTKQANSWVGMDPNFMINMWEVQNIVSVLWRYEWQMISALWNQAWPVLQQLTWLINQYQQSAQNSNEKWMQEAAANLKIITWQLSSVVADALNKEESSWTLSFEWSKDKFMLYWYRDKASKFMWYYQQWWADLHKQADIAMKPEVVKNIVNPNFTQSRVAKQSVIQNPFYLNELERIRSVSPALYSQLVMDMQSDTLTTNEKKVLDALDDNVIKPLKDQRKQLASQYWWTTVNAMFKAYEPLMNLSGIWYRTLMDDIRDEAIGKLYWSSTKIDMWDIVDDSLYTRADYSWFTTWSSYSSSSYSSNKWYNYVPWKEVNKTFSGIM